MILTILESPYSGDVEKNLTYARECMRDSIELGEAPIASHLLYTQEGILDDTNPVERSLGMAIGFNWGRYADKVVFYTDYGMSDGMKTARDYYERLGLPVEIRTLF